MELPKIITAGIYDSKIVFKNTAISKKRKTSMFEIELPIEKGGISYIENSTTPIVPETIICAKPNQIRHTKFPFKCYYIHLIIRHGPLYDILINTPEFFETDKYEIYKNLFIKLIKHFNSLSESEEIIIQSTILELIYKIGKDSAKQNIKKQNPNTNATVEKTINFIKEHLTEELTLNRIAKEMSLSPTYFHNIFRSSVGKTLHEYVEEQRIKKAIGLLQTTNYTLTKIAYECGFSSQSYFSFAFKRKMKKTPREYIREIYNKYEI